MVRTQHFHCRGGVQSVVGELSAHKPQGPAKKKKISYNYFFPDFHLCFDFVVSCFLMQNLKRLYDVTYFSLFFIVSKFFLFLLFGRATWLAGS